MLQKRHGLNVAAVDAQFKISIGRSDLAQFLAFDVALAGFRNHCFRIVLFCRQFVVALSPLHLALQFGDVPQVVQRKGIIRIDQVSAIEQALRLLEVVLLDFLHPLAIQLLHRSCFGALGNRDSEAGSNRRRHGRKSQ